MKNLSIILGLRNFIQKCLVKPHKHERADFFLFKSCDVLYKSAQMPEINLYWRNIFSITGNWTNWVVVGEKQCILRESYFFLNIHVHWQGTSIEYRGIHFGICTWSNVKLKWRYTEMRPYCSLLSRRHDYTMRHSQCFQLTDINHTPETPTI
jgi:hypothetical protein